MMNFDQSIYEAIFEDAKSHYPKESCGVVVLVDGVQKFIPCTNVAPAEQAHLRFEISGEDYARAEDLGEVLAIAHSHPNASANATDADIAMCERTGLPWIIVGVPSGVFKVIQPTGKKMPLLGRTFHHGVLDCYTLIRDYYDQRLGIDLPDFERHDNWWESGQDLYVQNFEKAGFEAIAKDGKTTPSPHDVILMQIRSNNLNHGAVMDAEKPGHIIHHLHGHLSKHDIWGGVWSRFTGLILRHKDLM